MSDNTGLILGVDPGKGGAWALLDADGFIFDVMDAPAVTGAAIGSTLRAWCDDLAPFVIVRAFVEQVGYMPNQRGGWTFAEGYGAILGSLGALAIPTETILPTTWKRTQGAMPPAGTPKAERRKVAKTLSRQRAMETWPLRADLFRRVKDDGRSDACLVARHGMTR